MDTLSLEVPPAPSPPSTRSDSAPAVLADLIAAGLVSHEMIGDPARLGGEAEALRLLCGLVAGPVWRIEPFHYAFRAAPGDLGGALGGGRGLGRGARGGAAGRARARRGLGERDRPRARGDGAARPAAAPPARARRGGARGALEAAGPGLQAVINARFAVDRRPARRRGRGRRPRRAAGGDRGAAGGDPRGARGPRRGGAAGPRRSAG